MFKKKCQKVTNVLHILTNQKNIRDACPANVILHHDREQQWSIPYHPASDNRSSAHTTLWKKSQEESMEELSSEKLTPLLCHKYRVAKSFSSKPSRERSVLPDNSQTVPRYTRLDDWVFSDEVESGLCVLSPCFVCNVDIARCVSVWSSSSTNGMTWLSRVFWKSLRTLLPKSKNDGYVLVPRRRLSNNRWNKDSAWDGWKHSTLTVNNDVQRMFCVDLNLIDVRNSKARRGLFGIAAEHHLK